MQHIPPYTGLKNLIPHGGAPYAPFKTGSLPNINHSLQQQQMQQQHQRQQSPGQQMPSHGPPLQQIPASQVVGSGIDLKVRVFYSSGVVLTITQIILLRDLLIIDEYYS